jgi:hypothetical protein
MASLANLKKRLPACDNPLQSTGMYPAQNHSPAPHSVRLTRNRPSSLPVPVGTAKATHLGTKIPSETFWERRKRISPAEADHH